MKTRSQEITRKRLEAKIEELIEMLDLVDGDENMEDAGDDEPSFGREISVNGKLEYDLEINGDEQDTSFCEDDGYTQFDYDRSGVEIADRLIRHSPPADKRAKLYKRAKRPPFVYDFRGFKG